MINKKIKKISFILILFFLLNIYIGYKFYIKNKYTESFVRLHVVANSNSIDDQIEKFKVYEKVSSYIDSLNLNINSDDILSEISNNSNNILDITNNEIKDKEYNAALKIGKINYEEKQDLTNDMPAGNYESVQIVIGKGEGKNIWSLICPNKENVKKLQPLETILPGISKIYDDNSNIEYDFKLKDLFN